jgi:hypothetical protein
MSNLEVPAVLPDLRYWKEKNIDSPLEVWSWLPERIAQTFNSLAKLGTSPVGILQWEPYSEKDLEKLHVDLAQFFLERLKTKGNINAGQQPTNEDFIEHRPIWRYCYIRALRELKTNPEGRGHHVLFWLKDNDTDPHVREAAKIAFKELRHGVARQKGLSPRRPLFRAFWWLRQAHLRELGIQIDERGAQRTLQKEIRWTFTG